jgi:cytoskeletal protein RodZ
VGAAGETGRILKDARTAAGRTLEDLARATRINEKYLSEIEEGVEFSLPVVYRRTFVRTCAKELGVDPDSLPEDEPDTAPGTGPGDAGRRSAFSDLTAEPPVEEGVTTPVSRNPFAEKSQIRTMAIVVVLLVTALVMSVRWLGPDGGEPGSVDSRMAGPAGRSGGERPASLPREGGVGALQTGRSLPADSLVFKATTTESVWVHVVIDNDSAVEFTLPPRYGITLKARDNFLLTVGNPAGLSIFLNGRKMEMPGDGNRPRKNIFLSRKSLPE